MARNLVCSENELSVALNKTERYIKFLEECISEYNGILDEVANEGMDTDQIRASLQGLMGRLFSLQSLLISLRGCIKMSIKKEMTEMEAVDIFEYPDVSLGDIKSLLVSFL